uniref:Uncharacterized protein n=1 Tax=Arundo donax TaxID=35708 RepID=A0A0A9D0P8_ARUDO
MRTHASATIPMQSILHHPSSQEDCWSVRVLAQQLHFLQLMNYPRVDSTLLTTV